MGNEIQAGKENSRGYFKRRLGLTQTAQQAAFILMGAALLSKVLGFLRDVFVGAYFGTTSASDILAGLIPLSTIFQDLVNNAIVIALIPVFIEEFGKNEEKAKSDFSKFLSIFLIVLALVCILISTFSGIIIKTLLPGIQDNMIKVAEAVLDIFAISSFLWATTDLFFGIAQAKKHFLITAILPLLANTSIIASLIFLSKKLGVICYPTGVILGAFLQLVIIGIYSFKVLGIRIKFNLNIKDSFIPKLLVLSIPLIIQLIINYSITFTGNAIVSKISEGGIAALSYANKLRLFSVSILTTPLAVSFYPFLSQAAANKDFAKLKEIFTKSLKFASSLIIPAGLVSVFFSETIIKIVFKRGAFDLQSVILTKDAFLYYSLGIFGVMLNVISLRVLYSLKKMKLTLIVSSAVAFANIILFLLLTKVFGHTGIAISISITAYLEAFVLVLIIRKEIGGIGVKSIIKSILKVAFSGLIAVFSMKLTFYLIGGFSSSGIKEFVKFSASGIIFLLIYLIMLEILKFEELPQIKKNIKRIFIK